MNQNVWLAVGAVAVIVSGATLWSGLRGAVNSRVGIVASGISIALWGVWTMHAYGVEVVTQNGTIVSSAYPSLAYLGFAMAVLMFVSLVQAALYEFELEVDFS